MLVRAISALLALAVLIGIYFFGETDGLYAICTFAVLAALREFMRLAFPKATTSLLLRGTFFVVAVAVYIRMAFGSETSLASLVFGAVVFLTVALTTVQSREDLNPVLRVQSFGLMGLLYCAAMPALTVRLLHLPQGDVWLFGLLAIVFSGDTMAYLVGKQFGKRRLLEAVSPKKSVEGAWGGLLGSGIAGYALSYFVTGQSSLALIGIAIATGLFAQAGDLFESLLKRVADVKDSGTMMPGHGGVLDRLDGVYFASPVYFILVHAVTS